MIDMSPRCSNCGTEVTQAATECPGCGLLFEDEKSGIPDRIPSSWIGLAAGLLLILLFILLGPIVGITGRSTIPLFVVIAAAISVVVWVGAEAVR